MRKTGLLALGIIGLAIFLGAFVTISHAAAQANPQHTVSNGSQPSQADVQQNGNYEGAFGDQTTPDTGLGSEATSIGIEG